MPRCPGQDRHHLLGCATFPPQHLKELEEPLVSACSCLPSLVEPVEPGLGESFHRRDRASEAAEDCACPSQVPEGARLRAGLLAMTCHLACVIKRENSMVAPPGNPLVWDVAQISWETF